MGCLDLNVLFIIGIKTLVSISSENLKKSDTY
jgi:hypothetical protein